MRSCSFKSALIVYCLLTCGAAIAEPTAEEWARVINLSGRQRMLTQKMSKEALFVTAGVDADKQRSALAETTAMFEETLAGLRDGNDAMKLPATENPRIVKQLDKVQSLYLELKPLFDSVTQGAALSSDEVRQLASKNVPLLEEMNKAVKMYERGAKKVLSNDASNAVAINLAGKQRMLTQKMTKEALLVHLSVDADQNLLNLRETTSLFDRTLHGLKDGDADLELPGTQNAELRAQLDKVETVWAKVSPLFDDELSGQDLTAAQLATLATENVTLLTEMNRGVGMFELAAK
jgi:hypothetical protein